MENEQEFKEQWLKERNEGSTNMDFETWVLVRRITESNVDALEP